MVSKREGSLSMEEKWNHHNEFYHKSDIREKSTFVRFQHLMNASYKCKGIAKEDRINALTLLWCK